MKAAALGLCLLVAVASAVQAADAPKFRDYPVTHVFNGKAAKLRLTGENKQYYSAYFEDAAAKGVTFAGHYAVVTRGCGSTCVVADILDLQTGRTFKVPFSISGWRDTHDAFEPVETKPESALIVFRGARNEARPLGAHYFVLAHRKLKFLRTIENDGNFREPLPQE